MHVAVVGGGIIGTFTAFFLHSRGCQVTIFDQASEPASATSRANGGQLSYSFCDAMADPTLLPKLPGILLGIDPAFKIKPSISADFYQWGIKFLRECRTERRDSNTQTLLNLAQRSSSLMEPLRDKFSDSAGYSKSGKLVLLGQPADTETHRRLELKQAMGLNVSILDEDQLMSIEPALKSISEPPVAAIYSPDDEAADAHAFINCLSHYLKNKGVSTRFGETVEKLKPQRNGQCLLKTTQDELSFNAVVLATGDSAEALLRPNGIKLPVLGMSGYSWTYPAVETSPKVSITALSKRIVYSRLGEQIRIAGFADVNIPARYTDERALTLSKIAQKLMPDAADYANPVGDAWRGVRSMTPDSQPIIGRTRIPGVYTNLGHGMLGWTLGAATGEYVAQEITKNEG